MNICEYTTINKVKYYKDAEIDVTVSDQLVLDEIRQATKEIEDAAHRKFFPIVVTETYDTPRRGMWDLIFDHDVLAVTSLTNGDGTVIPQTAAPLTNWMLKPLNDWPKEKLTLLPGEYMWLPSSQGYYTGAITITGTIGYHNDYPSAWQYATALAVAALITDLTITVPTGTVNAGDLLEIDTEYIYAVSVSTGTPNDTITVLRGVNGSTAAAHLISAPVLRWDPGQDIEMLCRRAATAYAKLRSNPIGESVNVDGIQFTTPKDVLKWITTELKAMGKVRTGLG